MLPGEAKLHYVNDTGKLKEPELMQKEEGSRRIMKQPLMKYNNNDELNRYFSRYLVGKKLNSNHLILYVLH